MIFDAAQLALPLHLDADLVVVGSGPGGATAAMVAAEAGLKVVVLEAGAFIPPSAMTQREEQMLPELLWANGGRGSRDKAVKVHQGRGVGGSSLHNINLCKRIPPPILSAWHRERGLEHLPPVQWDQLYQDVEGLLQVNAVAPELWSRHNQLLQAGTEALGWRGGGLSHNRTGCVGSGFCLVGCAYDAKNNALKVMMPRAVKAGVQVLAHCQAVRVEHDGTRVSAVHAVALDPFSRASLGPVVVHVPRVCLSASATGTPALLLRSGVPDASGQTGLGLRIHPALVAAGDFEEPVRAWTGIPQTYECTEFLDFEAVHGEHPAPGEGQRTWIVTAFAHPVGTATMLPGHGAAHHQRMERYAHLGVLTGMIHDLSAGSVRPRGDLGLTIDYWPDEADRRELMFGLKRCCELLFAAGARSVYVPTDPVLELPSRDALSKLDGLELTRGLLDITAVHPMASVPMGDDPAQAPVDSRGKHHGLEGLWVADGSLFPTSIGGPPQLSIYAMGLHVGRAIAED